MSRNPGERREAAEDPDKLELLNERDALALEQRKLEFWQQGLALLHQVVPALVEQQKQRLEHLTIPLFRRATWTFAATLLVIVVGAGGLLYADRLSESNFTFVLGLVLGYLLSYLRLLMGSTLK